MSSTLTPPRRHIETIGWWIVTIATLVVLDDLAFGPFFWAISRLAGPLVAVVAIYLVYVPAQLFLVARGTTDRPGRFARFFLTRLDLERKSTKVAEVERSIRQKVTGISSAILLSLVLGGVIPPLTMWRHGYERRTVKRVSAVTAVLYATEFALLHGVVPSLF